MITNEWRFPREWTLEQFCVSLGHFVDDIKVMSADDCAKLQAAVVENCLVISMRD